MKYTRNTYEYTRNTHGIHTKYTQNTHGIHTGEIIYEIHTKYTRGGKIHTVAKYTRPENTHGGKIHTASKYTRGHNTHGLTHAWRGKIKVGDARGWKCAEVGAQTMGFSACLDIAFPVRDVIGMHGFCALSSRPASSSRYGTR